MKLPLGFTSWIQFYDYINKPELDAIVGERFIFSAIHNNKERLYKLSKRAIKAKCWEEIESLRMSEPDTQVAMFAMSHGYRMLKGDNLPPEPLRLLNKIMIHGV